MENYNPQQPGYNPNAQPYTPMAGQGSFPEQQGGMPYGAQPTQAMPGVYTGADQTQAMPGGYGQTQAMPGVYGATDPTQQMPYTPMGQANSGGVPGMPGNTNGYPGGPESPQEDKKKHIGVIIAIVAFAALLIGAGVAYAILAPANEPRDPVVQPSINENISVNENNTTVVTPDNANSNKNTNSGNSNSNSNTGSSTNTPNRGETAVMPATDITVYDLDDNPVSLSSFQGKPVVLNFWASWCGPCQSEMPEFEKMYQEYGDQIQFLMVDMTGMNGETKQQAELFIANNNYTFPIYFDTNGTAGRAYNITAIPQTYFIDANGNIVNSSIGALSSSQLQNGVQSLLS